MNPLAFLVPAFLAGLAAIAIPVLVHLRHRERKEPVRFPSLMFLRRIPYRQVRRQQIHQWPLFLLRVAAVALLVFAFARPFLRGRDAPLVAPGAQGREVVVLLDRSASMGYGSRWSRAQGAARDAVNGLGRDDRASLVLFDQGAAVNTRPTSDRTLLLAAIDAARPGAATTRYAPALRAAGEILTGTHLPRREAVLVSDFQRTGWRGEDLDPLPEGTVLRRVNVGSDSAPNLAIVSADLTATPAGVVVRARIAGSGIGSRVRTRAVLELDGRAAGTRDVTLDGDGVVTAAFDPVKVDAAGARGVVRLEPADSLASDDTFRFIASGERPLRVVLVQSPSAAPFLRRALEISRTPRVEVTPRASLGADLAAADVVILDDVPFPGGEAGRRLGARVREGMGLVVIAGANAGGWPRDLIPARPGATVDRSGTGGARLGAIRRDHPLFEPFRGPRSGDFGAARVWRYRPIPSDSLEVLARHDDGSTALAEVAAGRGRVLIWASALDNAWSDAPLQPVFLPLVHQLAQYAAGWVERAPAWSVGEVATVPVAPSTGTPSLLVLSPAGERARREALNGSLAVALEESGFYEVREGRSGGRLLATIAANPPAEETRLDGFEPDDLRLATGAADSVPARAEAGLLTPQEAEKQQGLWWYLIALVTLLLGVESMVANAGRRAGGQAAGGAQPPAGPPVRLSAAERA